MPHSRSSSTLSDYSLPEPILNFLGLSSVRRCPESSLGRLSSRGRSVKVDSAPCGSSTTAGSDRLFGLKPLNSTESSRRRLVKRRARNGTPSHSQAENNYCPADGTLAEVPKDKVRARNRLRRRQQYHSRLSENTISSTFYQESPGNFVKPTSHGRSQGLSKGNNQQIHERQEKNSGLLDANQVVSIRPKSRMDGDQNIDSTLSNSFSNPAAFVKNTFKEDRPASLPPATDLRFLRPVTRREQRPIDRSDPSLDLSLADGDADRPARAVSIGSSSPLPSSERSLPRSGNLVHGSPNLQGNDWQADPESRADSRSLKYLDQSSNGEAVSALSLTQALLALQNQDKGGVLNDKSSSTTFRTASSESCFFDAVSSTSSELFNHPHRQFRLVDDLSDSSLSRLPYRHFQHHSCEQKSRDSIGTVVQVVNNRAPELQTSVEDNPTSLPCDLSASKNSQVDSHHPPSMGSPKSDRNVPAADSESAHQTVFTKPTTMPHGRVLSRRCSKPTLAAKRSHSSIRSLSNERPVAQRTRRRFCRSQRFGFPRARKKLQATSATSPTFEFLLTSTTRLKSAFENFRRSRPPSRDRRHEEAKPGVPKSNQTTQAESTDVEHPGDEKVSKPEQHQELDPASEQTVGELVQSKEEEPDHFDQVKPEPPKQTSLELDSELAEEARDTVAELDIIPERYRYSPLANILAAATAAGEEKERLQLENYEKLDHRLRDNRIEEEGEEEEQPEEPSPQPEIPYVVTVFTDIDEYREDEDISTFGSDTEAGFESDASESRTNLGDGYAFQVDELADSVTGASRPKSPSIKLRELRRTTSISSFPSQLSLHVSPLQQHSLHKTDAKSVVRSFPLSSSKEASDVLAPVGVYQHTKSRFRENL